jgi:hypothetical protein
VGSDTFWVISQHLHGAGEAREKLRNTRKHSGYEAEVQNRYFLNEARVLTDEAATVRGVLRHALNTVSKTQNAAGNYQQAIS